MCCLVNDISSVWPGAPGADGGTSHRRQEADPRCNRSAMKSVALSTLPRRCGCAERNSMMELEDESVAAGAKWILNTSLRGVALSHPFPISLPPPPPSCSRFFLCPKTHAGGKWPPVSMGTNWRATVIKSPNDESGREKLRRKNGEMCVGKLLKKSQFAI